MPKLFYEDYCNGQGKVEIPNANHVGIELDDGTIIEISCNRHSHADDVDRARVSSHDALNFEPTASNSIDLSQASWSRAVDAKTHRVRPSQVKPPPNAGARSEADTAIDVIRHLATRIAGHSINTKSVAARGAMAEDLHSAIKTIRRAL